MLSNLKSSGMFGKQNILYTFSLAVREEGREGMSHSRDHITIMLMSHDELLRY
jgi:hypothetical protein